MRRNYLIAAALFSTAAFAQQPVEYPETDATHLIDHYEDYNRLTRETPVAVDGMETAIWSEDFANGIPSTWDNIGLSLAGTPRPNAEWEYRGPNTNPDTSVGTRGFTGPNPNGQPINSPTKANGFMIFDSLFKETGGTGIGQGDAAGGHIGVLVTDVINLTGEPSVMLEFYSYAYLFNARLYVAFSTNGGTTFPDTVEIHPTGDLAVNEFTPRDFRVLEDVSSIIGGESNVKMAFIFEGDERTGAAPPAPPTGSPHGFYWWMIDDIALKPLPSTFFTFESTQITTAQGVQDAPSYDILNLNPATSWGTIGHYGITTEKQARPIAFDANIRNFGSATQTNVALAVEVWRNGMMDTVITHTPEPIMQPGELKDFTFFTTDFWTPTEPGDYRFVYKVTSDSIDVAANNPNTIGYRPDSVLFFVPEETADQIWGMDYRTSGNSIGTTQLGDDGSGIAVRYEIAEGEVDAVWSARIGLSTLTEAGAEIEVEIFRVEDFLTAQAGSSVGFAFKTITQTDIDNGFVVVDFYDATQGTGDIPAGWTPAQNDSAVWAVVTMFSNNGSFPVRIFNGQTFQNTNQSLMFDSDQGTWFTGYSGGSRSLAQPHIRLIMESIAPGSSVSSVENNLGLNYYPNPTTGRLVLDFQEKHGKFADIRVMDMTGKVVHTERANTTNISQHQVELGNLSSGMYLMTVDMGGKQSTFKVTVEK